MPHALDNYRHDHGMTYMARALSGLLDTGRLFVHIGPCFYLALKAASLVIVPPHLAGVGWIVIRCASVASIVPLSSHLWE